MAHSENEAGRKGCANDTFGPCLLTHAHAHAHAQVQAHVSHTSEKVRDIFFSLALVFSISLSGFGFV